MSISGVSSTTDLTQGNSTQTKFKQVKDDFQQLGQALQSGDLNTAQQAFAALQQLMPNLSAGNQNNSQSPLLADLNAVGKALQSGDLSAAKAAFAKLQQDVQSVNKGHHHRHHHKAGSYQDLLSNVNDSSNQANGTTSVSQPIGQNLNILT